MGMDRVGRVAADQDRDPGNGGSPNDVYRYAPLSSQNKKGFSPTFRCIEYAGYDPRRVGEKSVEIYVQRDGKEYGLKKVISDESEVKETELELMMRFRELGILPF